MAVRSTWHWGVTVRDLERSIRFYRDLLRLEITHRQIQDNEYTRRVIGYPDARLEAVQFQIPGAPVGRSGHILELTQYSPQGPSVEPKTGNVGVAHLALEVDDIDDTYQRLAAAGMEFVSPPVLITEGINTGGFVCYLHDPDGITIELVEPAPGTNERDASAVALAG